MINAPRRGSSLKRMVQVGDLMEFTWTCRIWGCWFPLKCPWNRMEQKRFLPFFSFFLLGEDRGGVRGTVSIHGHQSFLCLPPRFCLSSSLVFWAEMMRLKSARCEFSSPQHVSGGLSGSCAINCGGVLSIRMNNLGGMLIGIPVLAKGTETKCCWKTFHHFCLLGWTSFVFFFFLSP